MSKLNVSDTSTTGPYLAQLISKLDHVEKQRKAELKFFNAENQKFRSKHPNIFNKNLEIIVDRVVDKNDKTDKKSSTRDYESLQSLLFTNGEIDIDKIICLHLLSIHKAEHLVQPKYTHQNATALDRILERSNKKSHKVAKSELPSYVLGILNIDAKPESKEEDVEFLPSRLLINEKISMLIQSVLAALKSVNKSKLESLIDKVRNADEIRKILVKTEIQEFFKYLETNTLLLSCDSFVLSHSFKVRPMGLDIKPSKILENLINIIRKSVLQLPLQKRGPQVEEKPPPLPSKLTKLKEKPLGEKQRINYIERNIENIAKASQFNRSPRCDPKRKCHFSDECKDCRFHLKQTTCAACMEKWKIPLPKPKSPDLPVKLPTLVKTDSLHMLQNMIDAELFALESYDRRFSPSSTSRSSKSSRVSERSSRKSSTVDEVRLGRHDLEKIKNDIRSKETMRKLNEFLCSCPSKSP